MSVELEMIKRAIAEGRMTTAAVGHWATKYLPRAIALEEFYAAEVACRDCRISEYTAALDRFTDAQKAVAATDE